MHCMQCSVGELHSAQPLAQLWFRRRSWQQPLKWKSLAPTANLGRSCGALDWQAEFRIGLEEKRLRVPSCLLACLVDCLLACVRACLCACLLACLLVYLRACLCACLLACLLACCSVSVCAAIRMAICSHQICTVMIARWPSLTK